jgi:hypothetical protein
LAFEVHPRTTGERECDPERFHSARAAIKFALGWIGEGYTETRLRVGDGPWIVGEAAIRSWGVKEGVSYGKVG